MSSTRHKSRLLPGSRQIGGSDEGFRDASLRILAGDLGLYGPSGCYKSFLMLDLATHIAGGGTEWFGKRVTHCPVTYCVLEGEAGMNKRVIAWSQHHNKPIPESTREKLMETALGLLNKQQMRSSASKSHKLKMQFTRGRLL